MKNRLEDVTLSMSIYNKFPEAVDRDVIGSKNGRNIMNIHRAGYKYDFDPENIQEGIYQVTFSTEGRELKVHTTDYVEEGQEVGLTFEVEDIHVMEKMGF